MNIRATIILCNLLLHFVVFSYAEDNQNTLVEKCSGSSLSTVLIPGDDWVSFPSYYEREDWSSIDKTIASIIIDNASKKIDQRVEPISGFEYLQFKQGKIADDISIKLQERKERLELFVLAELVEGKGRFLDYVVDATWELCALNSWNSPVGQYMQTGSFGLPSSDNVFVDEYAGEIAGTLSWTIYFFEKEFDKIDPQITKWVKKAVKEKFLEPCLNREDMFWMAYGNRSVNYHAPWISYNWLLSNLLLENNNELRVKAVRKVVANLDHFMQNFPEDGACIGGPVVWKNSVAKYFECLELLDLVSAGEIYMFNSEQLRRMGQFISNTHIGNDYFMNYSSCPPNLEMPAGLIYRYGDKTDNGGLASFGAQLAKDYLNQGRFPISGVFSSLNFAFDWDYMKDEDLYIPADDVFFEESQIVVSRSEKNLKKGYFLGIKGGSNGEIQNQNDVGNFILYYDGMPVIVDPGTMSQTADMITSARYDHWINQSSYHNLPTVNGYMQAAGNNYRTINFKHEQLSNGLQVSMNLETAFEQKADIKHWKRTYNFIKDKGLEIKDDFSLYSVKGETYVSFMSYVKPMQNGSKLFFNVGAEQIGFDYDSKQFNVAVETVEVSDDPILNEWGNNIYRIILRPKSKSKSGNWTFAFNVE